MGGLLATHLAYCFPERVRFLVLLAPAGMMETPLFVHWMRTHPRWLTQRVSSLFGSVLWMKRNVWPKSFYRSDSAACEWYVKSMKHQRQTNPFYLKALLNDIEHVPVSFSENATVFCAPSPLTFPVLLLWGEDDLMVPLHPNLERYQRLFPHAESHVFRKARHSFYLEYPDATWERIHSFLRARIHPGDSVSSGPTASPTPF